MAENPVIRPATEADRPALYEICLRTADNGSDASHLYSEPRLPGFIWAAPYQAIAPDFAFVLDAGGGAVGYVVAAPDTAAFAARLEREWWPDVRRLVAGLAPRTASDERVLALIRQPETKDPAMLAGYPAHLHINLLPPFQSSGWGRRLVETELAALRAGGVPGLHLGVSAGNTKVLGFYEKLGFREIARPASIYMGMRL
ncbi:GNAT family N-acetyltransferase [Labrys sp. LIt4]|uniref:GNAT family N-acetyltransferase n=1 Tax=Labrys okinawensis TaxID=346911 RepID=A0A2S9QDR7_9HYPH|nr:MULTISPECIES: GNAT family N-acetyltransferase [Labrys]MBP0580055.1 GNAT family N-acetyltransferase [Labrys sp. LIt4]PRH87492.1 GNAT family N-acetyltransferase [Labrys okinawensis]